MDGCCTPKCMAMKMLILGLILILVRYFKPNWDIFIVIGVLLIIKAIILFIMPICPCQAKVSQKKK